MVVIKFGKFKLVFKWIREYLSVGRGPLKQKEAQEKSIIFHSVKCEYGGIECCTHTQLLH